MTPLESNQYSIEVMRGSEIILQATYVFRGYWRVRVPVDPEAEPMSVAEASDRLVEAETLARRPDDIHEPAPSEHDVHAL